MVLRSVQDLEKAIGILEGEYETIEALKVEVSHLKSVKEKDPVTESITSPETKVMILEWLNPYDPELLSWLPPFYRNNMWQFFHTRSLKKVDDQIKKTTVACLRSILDPPMSFHHRARGEMTTQVQQSDHGGNPSPDTFLIFSCWGGLGARNENIMLIFIP